MTNITLACGCDKYNRGLTPADLSNPLKNFRPRVHSTSFGFTCCVGSDNTRLGTRARNIIDWSGSIVDYRLVAMYTMTQSNTLPYFRAPELGRIIEQTVYKYHHSIALSILYRMVPVLCDNCDKNILFRIFQTF